jgi:multidrug efflux pump subunit AcrA (membrane-fusion protein)/YHS domain-containing protein
MSVTPGTVVINQQKQQTIGVQVGEVTKTAEISTIRALGRIVPDENRVYNLIAATEGWVEEVNESTTGSMVSENQLLAQIKIYNYDFYTWQQRYLTELGFTNRISMSASPLSGSDQSRRRVTSGAGYQAGLPIPESEVRMIRRRATISQLAARTEHQPVEPQSVAADSIPKENPKNAQTGSPHHSEMTSATTEEPASSPGMDPSQHMESMTKGSDEELDVSHKNNLLYSSKGRQELLNSGVAENQLQSLAESGAYITHVDLRSPVNGYLLARKVFSLQRIDRGTECFRIADLGTVWVEADIFDIEAKSIQPGMQAKVSLPRQKAHLAATVSEILPRFDAAARTLKVRLEMDNPELAFRPDMFVDVEFLVPLPESISVPSGAVIDSGKRQTVYVVKEEGIFEPREVATGWRSSDRIEIVSGLQPGEKIVVSGNFLIDSESRMKLAALKLMEEPAGQPVKGPDPAASAVPVPQAASPVASIEEKTIAGKSKDPICGMTVSHDHAMADGLIVEAEGKTHYFCSAECMEQFKKEQKRLPTEKTGEQAPAALPGHGGHAHD